MPFRPARLVLCVLAFCAAAAPARAETENQEAFVRVLTEDNIRAFLEEARAISTSRMLDMGEDEIAAYLDRHLSGKGSFRSTTTYEIPGYPLQEVPMEYAKDEFIASVVEGQGLMEDYETALDISSIKIAGNGQSASLRAVISENGRIPWPDGKGGTEMVTVKGLSECDQKVAISLTNYIQLVDTDCKTVITFAPFTRALGGE